ncbi:MAG TPA: nucleotidyltransferase domain-containing protein [Candidatus Saccharimonadales bacterium]|jgi:predicted nucleotidyltransferase|nr:nucleotidyltransferase domain-containing protein [Candidatus Saccharimonadales bacterium]
MSQSESFLSASSVLQKVRQDATEAQRGLDQLLTASIGRYNSEDTSLVVFGSLARGEWTSGSDLDWTYLVDGQANSDHLRIAQRVGAVLKEHKDRFRPPGQTGTFGNLAFSHELVHQIGGQFDSNKNTTQRVLLLLESAVIGSSTQAYDRVLKAVIRKKSGLNFL